MKTLKIILKIFVICALLAAVVTGAVVLYMKFYGQEILENALSDMLGSEVEFESVSLNLKDYAVNFSDFSIASRIDLEENVLNAEKFTIILNEEMLKQEKQVVFDEIIIEKGTLNVTKDRKGGFNVSYNKREQSRYEPGVAYAQEPEMQVSPLHDLIKAVKKLTIKDSVVNYKDLYVPYGPFTITLDKFDLSLTSGDRSSDGAIPVACVLSFRIPNDRYRDSGFALNAKLTVYKYWTNVEMVMETSYIDVMQFFPYFSSYTPFIFKDGLFSSNTKFRMHDDNITSLTTMEIHRLNFTVDPHWQNGQFLNANINRLVPYLRSSRGDLIFDFVVIGTVDDPQIGVGPRVKKAIGMVVKGGMAKVLRQLQAMRI